MRQAFALAVALTAAGSPRVARGQELCVGDPAAKLGLKEFVRGAPVTAFKPGTVTVLEFWATWYGPGIDAANSRSRCSVPGWASRAVALGKKLAAGVYKFAAGSVAEAVAAQERAVKQIAGTDYADDPGFAERLARYKAALPAAPKQ